MNSNKTLLHILLVLSFIGAGTSAFTYLITALFLPQLAATFEANPSMLPAEMYTMMERFFEVPRPYYAACSLLYGLELAGAVLMWNLRRSGFHCYTIARLLLLLLPLLFLGAGYVGWGDLMFAALFIVLYYTLLRQLDVFKDNGGEPDDNIPTDTEDQQ